MSEDWTSKTAGFAFLAFQEQVDIQNVPPLRVLWDNVRKLADAAYFIDVAF